MRDIKLNGKKYSVPQSWDEVTLEMQMKVSADSDAIQSDTLKKYSILSGYAGIPIDVLKHAKITDLQQLFKAIEFINTELPNTEIIEFDFNGKHFYCGQNLIDMEFQDFISIENTLSEYSGNTYNALPTILAIMCKLKKDNGVLETIDDYNVLDRAILFKKLPITIAHQLSLFFSRSEMLYSSLFQLSLNPEMQKTILQKQTDSVENTLKEWDGKGLLTRFVRGILRHCLKSIKRQQDKLYTSSQ